MQLKKNPNSYRLFLFIAQFEDGLTELDFTIMSNNNQIKTYEEL
jgi:hypothetical protein